MLLKKKGQNVQQDFMLPEISIVLSPDTKIWSVFDNRLHFIVLKDFILWWMVLKICFQWKIVKMYQTTDRRDGVVVRASALQSVDLGFDPLVKSYQKTFKNGIHNFPAWCSEFNGGCGEQASKFACCLLGQGTLRDAPPLYGRQVPQTPRKWQLPSDCRRPTQNIAIQFAFS